MYIGSKCVVISMRFFLSLSSFISAMLMVNSAAAQQERQFIDEFTTRSMIEIDSLRNAGVDTVAGEITLMSIDSTISTGSSFEVSLPGIETRFIDRIGTQPIAEVVDIDVFPDNPDIYLITDRGNKIIFSYNAVQNEVGLRKSLNLTLADAFVYIDAADGRRKVIVTGSDQNANGVVLQLEWDRDGVVDKWQYQVTDPNLILDNPSDAVISPQRPNKLIICDTGKNRLVEADLRFQGNDSVRVLIPDTRSQFFSPVDVEARPDSLTKEIFLVTDRNNHRVLFVELAGDSLKWVSQIGITGFSPFGSDSTLNQPTDADVLKNGNILIGDAGNRRVIEIDPTGQAISGAIRGDQIKFHFSPIFSLMDADRLANRRTLVAAKETQAETIVAPKKLAYTDSSIVSNVFSFGRPVNFDLLEWFGEDAATDSKLDSTRIRLQMRSSNTAGSAILNEPWFGPTGMADFYETRIDSINPIHDGHSFYQFRVFLETDTPLRTPKLDSIRVAAHFIRFETPGVVLSKSIGDPNDNIITEWVSLSFPHRGQSVRVEILDADNHQVLGTFSGPEQPIPSLTTRVPALLGKQKLRLRATLTTQDPFETEGTPVLLNWRLVYRSAQSTFSTIAFTDAQFMPVNIYRIGLSPVDSVFLSLFDPSLVPTLQMQDTVVVNVSSARTEDSEQVVLTHTPLAPGSFRSHVPIFMGTANAGNDTLEVRDRDTLFVSYVDPFDTTDVSRDTAAVFQLTLGTLQIENVDSMAIDSVDISGFFFVRVTGENDQNLSPTERDSIRVLVFVDRQNGEQETIKLFELPNSSGEFNTGNFRNEQATQIVNRATSSGDRRLQAFGGEDILARYTDPDVGTVSEDTVTVRIPPDDSIGILDVNQAFNFIIAPNPFVASEHSQLNLRAQVRSGSMTLQRVEVYTLAGDKITTTADNQVMFGSSSTISSSGGAVDAFNWWNMKTPDGAAVASGTYFVKFNVRLINSMQGIDDETSTIRKLVIIQ